MKPRRPDRRAPATRRRAALPAEVPVVAQPAPLTPPPLAPEPPPEPTDMTEDEIVHMLKSAYT